MTNISNLKSVLVVEVDFLIAADIEQMLTDNGCGNVEVTSTCIDLVTVDVDLRDGSCERLVAYLNERNIAFVYVSGFTEMDQPTLPTAPWLSKPVAATDMVGAARSLTS